jgi:uncharacterized protein (DUF488 family)
MHLLTVGHSTRSVGELIDLLVTAGTDIVADVRTFPHSRRYPHFNIETLPAALAAAGIEYRHLPALGGRRGRQDLGRPSPNTAWREPGFRNFADYALGPEFAEGLRALRGLASAGMVAAMCAEALWTRCHRRIITDYLLGGGDTVDHIVGLRRIEPARITPGAVVVADGTLHYPPGQPELL